MTSENSDAPTTHDAEEDVRNENILIYVDGELVSEGELSFGYGAE